MNELIKVGDTVVNIENHPVLISSVEKGEFGLLIRGEFNNGISCEGYVPYELSPPDEEEADWYGWACKSLIKVGRVRLGMLEWVRGYLEPPSIGACDAWWLESVELMKLEVK